MEKYVPRMFAALAVGLFVTGLAVGLIPAECGDQYGTCNGFNSPVYRWVPVTLMGVALTFGLAAGAVWQELSSRALPSTPPASGSSPA